MDSGDIFKAGGILNDKDIPTKGRCIDFVIEKWTGPKEGKKPEQLQQPCFNIEIDRTLFFNGYEFKNI